MVTVQSVIEMLGDERFWRALAFAWMVTPVGFVLVGVIFESSLVPLWRDQARGFIPGDIALGVVFAISYYLYPGIELASNWRTPGFAAVAFAMSGGLFWLMRTKLDGPKYRPEELRTPTKRYHDIGLFFVYTGVLVYVCVPALLATPWGPGFFGVKFVALAALAVWGLALVLDENNPSVPSKRAHNRSYDPIWRRRSLT